MMEVYAGALSHADYNIGRFLDPLEVGRYAGQVHDGRQGRERRMNPAGHEQRGRHRLFLLSIIDELGGPPRLKSHNPHQKHRRDGQGSYRTLLVDEKPVGKV
jgi:hypothetical protein